MADSGRVHLQTLLAANLPADVKVIPYSTEISPPQDSTVMIRLDTVSPNQAGYRLFNYEFALILIAGNPEVGAGDDELEQLLEDVLFVVLGVAEVSKVTTWRPPATRGIYGGSNPSFQVDVTVTFSK